MKRLTSLPTSRFIFSASEVQPVFDSWIVQQSESVSIDHVERPNLYLELMESVSRILVGITVVLIAVTILAQLTKKPEEVPMINEGSYQAPSQRVQWGAR